MILLLLAIGVLLHFPRTRSAVADLVHGFLASVLLISTLAVPGVFVSLGRATYLLYRPAPRRLGAARPVE